jgi:hypothetical protein
MTRRIISATNVPTIDPIYFDISNGSHLHRAHSLYVPMQHLMGSAARENGLVD